MKKIFKLALIVAVALPAVTFVGCKKGENDPFLSLRSRKGRVAGEWKLASGEGTDTPVSGTASTWTYDGEKEITVEGSAKDTSFYTQTYNFEKDGSWTGQRVSTETEYFFNTKIVTVTTSDTEGTWNFTGGVGEMKNKSQLVITTNKMTSASTTTTTSGSQTTTTSSNSTASYTGSDAPYFIVDVDQLKNKEMIWKFDGSTTTSGTSTSSGTWTLTQE